MQISGISGFGSPVAEEFVKTEVDDDEGEKFDEFTFADFLEEFLDTSVTGMEDSLSDCKFIEVEISFDDDDEKEEFKGEK